MFLQSKRTQVTGMQCGEASQCECTTVSHLDQETSGDRVTLLIPAPGLFLNLACIAFCCDTCPGSHAFVSAGPAAAVGTGVQP